MIYQFTCKFCTKYRLLNTKLEDCNIIRNFYILATSYGSDKYNNTPLKKMLDESASLEDISIKHPTQQWITLPYTEKTRKQGDFVQSLKHDPRDSSVILFPGQGSQYVGMVDNLMKFPMVKDLFELSNYILGYDLLKLCTEGPKEKLDQTKYCQPAVMVSSLAAIEKLKEERPNAIANCVATAGFSLGEITALVFAGALPFEEALQLVKIRAEAMQLASEVNKGGMVIAIYGPDSKLNYACLKAREWAQDKGDAVPECRVANYLYPHCKVISGSESAIAFLENNFKEFGIRKIKRISVNGAFHCDLMAPAVEPFRKKLNKLEISDPVITVYSCVDGKRYRNAEHIRRQLPKQIIKPVKWEQLLHVMYTRDPNEYFPKSFECGPGTFLKTVLKQVNAKAGSECHATEENK